MHQDGSLYTLRFCKDVQATAADKVMFLFLWHFMRALHALEILKGCEISCPICSFMLSGWYALQSIVNFGRYSPAYSSSLPDTALSFLQVS